MGYLPKGKCSKIRKKCHYDRTIPEIGQYPHTNLFVRMTYAAVAAKSSWFLGLAVNVIAAGNRKMKVTTRAILDLLLQGIAKRTQTGIPVSVTASAVTITRPRYVTLGLSRSRTFRT